MKTPAMFCLVAFIVFILLHGVSKFEPDQYPKPVEELREVKPIKPTRRSSSDAGISYGYQVGGRITPSGRFSVTPGMGFGGF